MWNIVIEKSNEFWQKVDNKIGKLNILQKVGIVVDYGMGFIFQGTSMADYFQYDFYSKNQYGRSKYITRGKLIKFTEQVNDLEKAEIFRDKGLFLKTFKDYVCRESVDMRVCTLDIFKQFVYNHNRFIVKPCDGSWGRDVRIEEIEDDSKIEILFKKLQDEKVIIEEVIKQHTDLAAFNQSSTNTIRIVSFVRANGDPFLLPGATIRIGRQGKQADNFHHGGIAAQIDIETGYVVTKGIDKNGNRYTLHPDSNILIPGFKIPLWKEICQSVLEAALIIPEVRYVGWDVTVNEYGKIIFIEGNDKADPDLSQMSDGVGKWPIYEQYMKEVFSLKKD